MDRFFPYSSKMAEGVAKSQGDAHPVPAIVAIEPYHYEKFEPVVADHLVTKPMAANGVTSFEIHKNTGEGFERQSRVQIWSKDPISDSDVQTAISFADFLEHYMGVGQIINPASFKPINPEMIQAEIELQKSVDAAVDRLVAVRGTEQEEDVLEQIKQTFGETVANIIKMMADLKQNRPE